ncbi:MarC family NAAT transporter [Oxalobacter sp. OttesenSCG-928-P03]|nr:MarC family NAAT transporter [Oxalobacter sp. OttesenSCG-928-P03]
MLDLFKLTVLGVTVILPLANPLTTVALLLGISGHMTPDERNEQSLKASIYVCVIMLVTFYAGQIVMKLFGISIQGLRIAGGMIVAVIGFRMLFPSQSPQESTEAELKSAELNHRKKSDIAFVPLAMPSTAGPGTMAMIITSTSAVTAEGGIATWVYLLAPITISVIVSAIVWGCMRSSNWIMRLFGNSGIDAISRVMGFLLICMAVQFAINGILEIVGLFGLKPMMGQL